IQHLPSGQEISACDSVYKRWLTLISNIRKDEIAESNGYLPRCLVGWKITYVGLEAIFVGTANHGGLAKLPIWGNNLYRGMTDVGLKESNGYLARSLVGRKVTIVKLVAIAVGTSNRGGLTKLSIQGNNLCRGVTYIGLKDISRGSPTLREHSLWNVSSVGDEGLSEIAHECHLLEKLDLFQCPRNRVHYTPNFYYMPKSTRALELAQKPRDLK
ncbi:hypothetical protein MTR67_001045, partial [Solanum verrucosum]